MDERIYLGRHPVYGLTYLSKHSWDCGWYWGFGYIGNKRCYWHIDALLENPERKDNWTDVKTHFNSTWITQDIWWVVCDLFIQAYALRKAADSYAFGGHQTKDAGPMRIINPSMAKAINADLKTLLDNVWNYLSTQRELHA